MNIVDPLYLRAIYVPEQLFLITPQRSWSYFATETEVNQIISLCLSLGIKPGQKVAILAPNQPAYIFWILALTRLGAIIVCLHIRLSKEAIKQQLQTIGIKYLVTDIEIVLPDLITIFPTDYKTKTKFLPELPPVWHLKRPHSIFFSSGTTGTPKAISLTLGNHYYSAIGVLSALSISISDQSWLLCLPLFHVAAFAIVWRCLWSGLAIFLTDRFDADEVIQSVIRQSIGWASFVPTMLVRILEHPSFLNSLSFWQKMKGIMIGGAPMPLLLQEQCLTLQLPIVTTYGLTEASSTVTTLTPQEWRYKPRSSGKPIPGIELKITGTEIMIKGRSVFTTDWLHTKDIGYLDEEGYLFLTDRLDNMIICGGENIFPNEIESVLLQHPSIQDICVIPQQDLEWGQIALAIVKATTPIELKQIKEFCLSRSLPAYKIPKALVLVENIPKTASGKTDRATLKAQITPSSQSNTTPPF